MFKFLKENTILASQLTAMYFWTEKELIGVTLSSTQDGLSQFEGKQKSNNIKVSYTCDK